MLCKEGIPIQRGNLVKDDPFGEEADECVKVDQFLTPSRSVIVIFFSKPDESDEWREAIDRRDEHTLQPVEQPTPTTMQYDDEPERRRLEIHRK